MVQNFIWKSGLKHGDMENRVDTSESVRKLEGKGMGSPPAPAFTRISKGPRNLSESLWDGRVVQKNVFQNTVFGEHVHNEQHCKVFGSAVNGCRNEYALLRESVNNHQD